MDPCTSFGVIRNYFDHQKLDHTFYNEKVFRLKMNMLKVKMHEFEVTQIFLLAILQHKDYVPYLYAS